MEFKKSLKHEKILSIVNHWVDKKDWIQSSKLVERFVKSDFNNPKYKEVIFREDGIYYDPKKRETQTKRPEPLFSHKSVLYRYLKDMTEYGILEREERQKDKNQKKLVYYRPTNNYQLLILKYLDQDIIDRSSFDQILFSGNNRFYMPGISLDDLDSKDRLTLIEIVEKLNDIQLAMGSILRNNNDKKKAKIWDEYVLKNKKLCTFEKLLIWIKILLYTSISTGILSKQITKQYEKGENLDITGGSLTKEDADNITYMAISGLRNILVQKFEESAKQFFVENEDTILKFNIKSEKQIIKLLDKFNEINVLNNKYKIVVSPMHHVFRKTVFDSDEYPDMADTKSAYKNILDQVENLSGIEPIYINTQGFTKGFITKMDTKKINECKQINSKHTHNRKKYDFFTNNDVFTLSEDFFNKYDINKNDFYNELDKLSGIFSKPDLPEHLNDYLH